MSSIKVILTTLVLVSFVHQSYSQTTVPSELSSLVGLNLDAAEAKLESMGYEITHSSLSGKKQSWYHESKNVCVDMTFEKGSDHKVSSFAPGNLEECKKGLMASRAVWEHYHDGPSPANDAKLNAERQKLAGKGFKVSYYIVDLAPGRSAEYWYNETENKTMLIAWDTGSFTNMEVNSTDSHYGKNPAPKKN